MASIILKLALAVAVIGLFLYPIRKLREGFVVIGIVIAAALSPSFRAPLN